MNKKLPIIAVCIIVLLLVVLGAVIIQKSWTKTGDPKAPLTTRMAKKIDMASQPEWVQKLQVSAVKGVRRGSRGLDNVKVTVEGIPQGMVDSLTYTMSYSYETKLGEGSGGFFTDTPVEVKGTESFTRTFDFGTCSTKSCVRHDGVKSMEIEIDFVTSAGDEPIWSGTVEVK